MIALAVKSYLSDAARLLLCATPEDISELCSLVTHNVMDPLVKDDQVAFDPKEFEPLERKLQEEVQLHLPEVVTVSVSTLVNDDNEFVGVRFSVEPSPLGTHYATCHSSLTLH